MIVAGVFLKANLARIVTLKGSRSNHTLIASKFNKLELPKNPTQDDVEAFAIAFKAFCSDHSVDKVIINKRATTGQGAGGAGSFILEGVLLAVSPVPIEFIHSATVASTDRKQKTLKVNQPTTVDLGKAYDFSFEGLQ